MIVGISIREFARRAECDDKVVRRKVKSEHIQLLADGTIDPRYLEIDWRSGDALPADSADTFGLSADTETLDDVADKIASIEGRAQWSKAEAERVKENYAALLRQLEYDRESGLVVEIDDVVIAVASEYALVRNKLLNIGSRVAPDISTMDSPEEIKALIDKHVIEALKGLTLDGDGERDFEKLRGSVQSRLRGLADEDASSQG